MKMMIFIRPEREKVDETLGVGDQWLQLILYAQDVVDGGSGVVCGAVHKLFLLLRLSASAASAHRVNKPRPDFISYSDGGTKPETLQQQQTRPISLSPLAWPAPDAAIMSKQVRATRARSFSYITPDDFSFGAILSLMTRRRWFVLARQHFKGRSNCDREKEQKITAAGSIMNEAA